MVVLGQLQFESFGKQCFYLGSSKRQDQSERQFADLLESTRDDKLTLDDCNYFTGFNINKPGNFTEQEQKIISENSVFVSANVDPVVNHNQTVLK